MIQSQCLKYRRGVLVLESLAADGFMSMPICIYVGGIPCCISDSIDEIGSVFLP
jgi:hypothetical protein